jgi:DNA-binding GntR family transcriptional regulator
LREAMSRLVADGLVEFEDQRGYRVAPVSLANLDEVIRIRSDFESLALRYAIEAGDLDWESRLIASLHRLDNNKRDSAEGQRLEAWENVHAVFHRDLISGCAMPVLLRFCRMLYASGERYRRIFLVGDPGERDVDGEHAALAHAALGRRPEEACTLLRRHIESAGGKVRSRLVAVLSETPGPGVADGPIVA